jgi:small subunit ribosomal protein S13
MGMRKPKTEKKTEEAKKEKDKEKKPEKKRKIIEGIRGIVRVSEVDLDGSKKVKNAILGIKGIGKSLAGGIVTASGLDSNAMLGSLTEEQIHKLEDAIKNPSKYGIPFYMLNRRFDPSTGENKHLVSSELKLAVKSDIDFMKKIRCYKGVRHELGLPVRGQRTRSSFRTGMIVGVSKAKMKPGAPATGAPAAGAPQPTKEGKPAEAKPGTTPAKAPASAPAKAEKKEEKK